MSVFSFWFSRVSKFSIKNTGYLYNNKQNDTLYLCTPPIWWHFIVPWYKYRGHDCNWCLTISSPGRWPSSAPTRQKTGLLNSDSLPSLLSPNKRLFDYLKSFLVLNSKWYQLRKTFLSKAFPECSDKAKYRCCGG